MFDRAGTLRHGPRWQVSICHPQNPPQRNNIPFLVHHPSLLHLHPINPDITGRCCLRYIKRKEGREYLLCKQLFPFDTKGDEQRSTAPNQRPQKGRSEATKVDIRVTFDSRMDFVLFVEDTSSGRQECGYFVDGKVRRKYRWKLNSFLFLLWY